MAYYRPKTELFKAEQYQGALTSEIYILLKNFEYDQYAALNQPTTLAITIGTERVYLNPGTWIVVGFDGEIKTMGDLEFKATYEAVK